MKPVAIVMTQSNRTKLTDQTLTTLDKTLYTYWQLNTKDGMKDGEMKAVNSLIESIDYDWEWLVRIDDDLYFDKKWLNTMLSAMKNNPDVWLLGGCRYPTHKIIEERKDIYIMDIAPGNCWLIKREVFDKFGPFYDKYIPGEAEDTRFCQTLQEAGGKVAVLKDPTLVVHCGITGTSGKGRSPYVTKYIKDLADKVGVYTE